jgi:hypothetical protein
MGYWESTIKDVETAGKQTSDGLLHTFKGGKDPPICHKITHRYTVGAAHKIKTHNTRINLRFIYLFFVTMKLNVAISFIQVVVINNIKMNHKHTDI